MFWNILILFAYGIYKSHSLLDQDEDWNFFHSATWSNIENSLNFGEIKGYYSIDEFENYLLPTYQQNFPEIIANVVDIGNTREGLRIYAIQLTYEASRPQKMTPTPINSFVNSYSDRPAILLTGMHEGSDPTSMMIVIYTLKKFIFGYVKNDPSYMHLLKTRQIWLIPFLNKDTYTNLIEYFLETGKIPTLFSIKNRRPLGCVKFDGVYLRQNYPQSDTGDFDRGYPCDYDYAGESALSEPETIAMNGLLDKVTFSVAFNFFLTRDALLVPLNYLASKDYSNPAFYKKDEDYSIFEEIYLRSGMNKITELRNTYSKDNTIYQGDVTDYMYWKKGIYALSVEIKRRTIYKATQNILTPAEKLDLLQDYYPLIQYSTFKISQNYYWTGIYQLIEECLEQHIAHLDCKTTSSQVYSAKYSITNDGLVDATNVPIIISTPSNFKIEIVKKGTSYNDPYNFRDTVATSISFTKSLSSSVNTYQFTIPSIPRRSTVIISIAGLYRPTSTSTSSLKINLSVQNGYSYQDKHIEERNLTNFGNVESFKKIIYDENSYTNLRQPSNILLFVYFSILSLVIAVSVIIHCVGAKTASKKIF